MTKYKIKFSLFLLVLIAFCQSAFAESASIDKIIEGLNSHSRSARCKTVDKLVQMVPGEGRRILPKYLNNDKIKESLINFLEDESKKGPIPGEGYAECESILLSAVSCFRDERITALFLGEYFGANSDVIQYLIKTEMGKIETRLFDQILDNRYPGKRIVFLRIVKGKSALNLIKNQGSTKVKKKIIELLRDDNFSVRIHALRAIKPYMNDSILAEIDKISKNDNYFITIQSSDGLKSKRYPVREEAIEVLKRAGR